MDHPKTTSRRILVMGVSGSGKSHIGRLLAERLGVEFIDGDDHHPQANIDKMARGIPLNDDDRQGWLDTLAGLIADYHRRDASLVIGCSALKRRYRDQLRSGDPALAILFLEGSREQLLERLTSREGHFFTGEAMLESQLADLEPPGSDEAITLNIGDSPESLAAAFIASLDSTYC
ncbi:gluconokinase [Halomonas urumqiensis]|uniref:Gluconokinase n=1 Tax=Halomonas urumqiensis TaxID=1684789 RepID=A0A2N7UQT0_9GAMM|nr:gluconokinase [Halomonas urumqiensis]PMR82793.1 gluconate kinase [Halomonas urumqiensis]PTB01888.1 gluconokinase [Halomonas urumqiensis]GHE21993.1 gluconokinase [Halomonas urumqiensis]